MVVLGSVVTSEPTNVIGGLTSGRNEETGEL